MTRNSSKLVTLKLHSQKNVFYFILKANSILKISKFCPYFFDDIRKGFDKKAKINFKTEK